MILYEDNAIIVCHKRAGIPVQSAKLGQKDMVSILNNHLAADQSGGRMEPVRIVHRLDQPVEGVMVFAKTQEAAAKLSRQITAGSMKKKYQAVCCVTEDAKKHFALQPGEECTLVDYLAKNTRSNTSAVVRQGDKNAKRAELTFTIKDVNVCSGEASGYVLAEIDLKTGRHHQIRVQMANAGLPLYGDRKYNLNWQETCKGRAAKERIASDHMKGCINAASEFDSLALCAVSLTFCHPVSGKVMNFTVQPQSEVFRMWDGQNI